ncbi:MAG: hypothetical protein A2Y25_01555 [Candidatus Melainabacteria bacterium GWF2_37_15]|nr:MAG: hypothetical protein A2Y25_01555 [Candidatus Melainabacteria bacterium GWF2_37_15]
MLKKTLCKIQQPLLWYKISRLKAVYKNKRIALYGAGVYAREIFENFNLSGLNIIGCIDKDFGKKGTKIAGYEIFFFNEIEALKLDLIVITTTNHNKNKIIPPILDYIKEKNLNCRVVYDFNYEVWPDGTEKSLNPILYIFDCLPSMRDLVMWAACTFLAVLIPKKRNSIVFIGKSGRHYLDNTKYLYNHIIRKKKKLNFSLLTEDKSTFELLKRKNLPVSFYPDLKTAWKLLRACIVIFSDSPNDSHISKYHLLSKTKQIQLWHGVGFKTIELTHPEIIENMKSIKHRQTYFLKRRFPRYDLLNSTSKFYTENVFKPAFNYKKVIEGGYPRNDVLFREADELDLIGIDTENYNKILERKNQGYKVVLYAPTFRDDRSDPIIDGIINLEKWSQYGEENKIVFVLKFHPIPNADYAQFNKFENIIIYNNVKDIYPVLKNIDLLITDYSSIYMDYLLTDKPVLFFPYDYDSYVTNNRAIQFNYNWITPGSKCYSQNEFLQEINNMLTSNIDNYQEKRIEIKNLAFKNPDGNSCERIWNYIEATFLHQYN